MEIESIILIIYGYLNCKSDYYQASTTINNCSNCGFLSGINKLNGEIDCGNWSVSYAISMYKYRPQDFVLYNKPIVNGEPMALDKLNDYSCYMDI